MISTVSYNSIVTVHFDTTPMFGQETNSAKVLYPQCSLDNILGKVSSKLMGFGPEQKQYIGRLIKSFDSCVCRACFDS